MAAYKPNVHKLISVLIGVLLALVSSVPATAADKEAVGKTLFTNVNVFDGEHEKLIANANVLVEGNRIKQVSTKPLSADGAPGGTLPAIFYAGRYYSVNDTSWDRTLFAILNILFQTTVGNIENVGVPITISK